VHNVNPVIWFNVLPTDHKAYYIYGKYELFHVTHKHSFVSTPYRALLMLLNINCVSRINNEKTLLGILCARLKNALFPILFFLIGIVGVESNWVHSALRPLIGLLCQPRVIMMTE
jgi:hypothetical protein